MSVIGLRDQHMVAAKEVGEALSQYRAVVLYSDGKVWKPGTKATSFFYGVTVDAKTTTQISAGNTMVDVQYGGIALCEADAPIAIGDYVTYDSNGRVVKADVSLGAELSGKQAKEVIGIAVEAATTDGDVISVEIRPMVATVTV